MTMTPDEIAVSCKAAEIFKIASLPQLANVPVLHDEVARILTLSYEIVQTVHPGRSRCLRRHS